MKYFLYTAILSSLFLTAGQMNAKKNEHDRKCCVDSSIAVAKFHEDSCNPIKGKNVLIIGASKGIGNGAAQAFTAAGANVVGTSRAPHAPEYAGQPWLSPVPLDLTIDESISNFFGPNGDKTVAGWDHVDILILGGLIAPGGSLIFSKAADLFPTVNTELLGRHRVVSHIIQKMQNVDDSRIITLSSIGYLGTLLDTISYGSNKGALNSWVRSWNAEALWLNKIAGRPVCKTTAIAFQGSWINTSLGSLPSTLCNVSEPFPYGIYASGIDAATPFMLGQGGFYGNSGQQGLTKEQAGKALLYMATVRNPEWEYVVLSEDEKWCINGEEVSVECFVRQALQHKCRDVITNTIEGYNYNAAYQNILNEGNSEEYSAFRCPPIDQSAPLSVVPNFPAGYPDCAGGFVPGVPANPTNECSVVDLVENHCKPNYTDVCPLPCATDTK